MRLYFKYKFQSFPLENEWLYGREKCNGENVKCVIRKFKWGENYINIIIAYLILVITWRSCVCVCFFFFSSQTSWLDICLPFLYILWGLNSFRNKRTKKKTTGTYLRPLFFFYLNLTELVAVHLLRSFMGYPFIYMHNNMQIRQRYKTFLHKLTGVFFKD